MSQNLYITTLSLTHSLTHSQPSSESLVLLLQ